MADTQKKTKDADNSKDTSDNDVAEKKAAEENTPSKEDSKEDSKEEKSSESPKSEKPKKKETKKDPSEEKGRWYVVHTQSGFEAKAKENLEQRIVSLGVEDKIFEIIVPMRDVVTINKGKKKQKKEKVFPGYILVRMIFDNESWIAVKTTQGITGFIGSGGSKPTPISEQEVQAIMKFVKQEQPTFKAKFSVGEAVRVTDGPFDEMIGTINKIDEEKGRVTVLVSIFGRETPVELDFLQVTKL